MKALRIRDKRTRARKERETERTEQMGINKLTIACVDSKHVSTDSSIQHLLMLNTTAIKPQMLI